MPFNQVILELRVFEGKKIKEFPNTESRRKTLHTWGIAHAKEDIQGHHIFRIEGPSNLWERILGDEDKKGS